MRRFFRLLPVLLIGLGVSCVSRQIIEEPEQTRLFVTRTADKVSLSWESKPDMAYTILYNTSLNSVTNWNVLPGLDHIRGTGRTLIYQDKVPESQRRFYRLQSFPAVSLAP